MKRPYWLVASAIAYTICLFSPCFYIPATRTVRTGLDSLLSGPMVIRSGLSNFLAWQTNVFYFIIMIYLVARWQRPSSVTMQVVAGLTALLPLAAFNINSVLTSPESIRSAAAEPRYGMYCWLTGIFLAVIAAFVPVRPRALEKQKAP